MKTLTQALRATEQVTNIPQLLSLTTGTLEAAARLLEPSHPPADIIMITLASAARIISRLRDEILAGKIQP